LDPAGFITSGHQKLRGHRKCLGTIIGKTKFKLLLKNKMDPILQEMQAEIQRLKIEVASTPEASPVSAMMDVTLVAGIKDWMGDSKGRTVHEFFAQIVTYAKVNNWTEEEKALIAKAKLQGIALQYVQGREILAHDMCPYAVLKEYFTERFSEKLRVQYM